MYLGQGTPSIQSRRPPLFSTSNIENQQGYFLLSVWVVAAAYDEFYYNLVVVPQQLELFTTGAYSLNTIPVGRLNTIPVVPRPAVQRPGGFRRPTTTRRPFKKRPTTAAIQPTTPRPQPLPDVRPQTRPPQAVPSNAPFDIPTNPETPQFPTIVPETPPSNPNQPQNPVVLISQFPSPVIITNGQPNESFEPILPNPNQSQIQPTQTDSLSPPFGTANQGFPNIPQIPDVALQAPEFPATNVPLIPPNPSVPESPPFPIVPELPSFPPTNVEKPPAAPSQSQSEAQPPFEGPNLPPNPPTSPTFASSQTNTGAGTGPLVFPVARPPLTTVTSRPPFRPRPHPAVKPPNAQPPFDSGPHVPPKPPPVPGTSTTSFGVNPAPPSGKPQRPLPPPRPILYNPLPLPKPPFQLSTTEKPSIIFNESSMAGEGNYTFDFLVSNSVYRKEQGFLKKSLVHPGHLIPVKTGAYSFTSPEGTFHRTDFVADEYGYRAFESTY